MKKTLSAFLALLIILTSLFANSTIGYSATKQFAIDKLQTIQTQTGFVPKKTAAVVGNCYGFVAAVCEKLYGVTYNGEGLYNAYQCRHTSGNYYTVKTYTTSHTTLSSTDVKSIKAFFVDNALTGDIIHYGSLKNGNNTHTFMIQSVDDEKMVIYHSNYASKGNSSASCHFDTIYWDSFASSPTESCYASNGDYSLNAIFYSKMKVGGLGISINRYTHYDDLFYAVKNTVPEISLTRCATDSIKVSWITIDGASKYQVQYKKSTDSKYTTATSSCKNNYYCVSKLQVGTKYNFRVRACYGDKWMEYSDVKTVKPLPPKPTVQLSVDKSGMKISWQSIEKITGVKVYRATSSNGTYKLLANIKDTSVETYIDTSVAYGKTYYYKLIRYYVDTNGDEHQSSAAVENGNYVISAPLVSSSRLSNSTMKFKFTGDSCADCFVYVITDSKGEVVCENETASDVVVAENLTLGENYSISVAQKNAIGISEYTVHTKQMLPPSSSSVTTQVKSNGIKITYNTCDEVSGYYIYRSTSENSDYKKIAQVEGADVSSYTDKTVKYGVTYYYKVRRYVALNDKTYLSSYSSASKGSKVSLGKTTVSASRKSATSVTVSWKKVTNATKYVLQYKVNGGSWKTYATITSTSKTVTSLKTGSRYYFRVKASNSIGSGSYSTEKSIQVMPPKMNAPKLSKKSNGVSVSWAKQSGVTGYRVYRCTSKNGTYTLVCQISSQTAVGWTDTSAVKGKGYYYKVVSYVKKGNSVYCSSKSDSAYIKFA